MTAQLPHGLIRVVSASHTELTSTDPADIIFERKQALFNFWKGTVDFGSETQHVLILPISP